MTFAPQPAAAVQAIPMATPALPESPVLAALPVRRRSRLRFGLITTLLVTAGAVLSYRLLAPNSALAGNDPAPVTTVKTTSAATPEAALSLDANVDFTAPAASTARTTTAAKPLPLSNAADPFAVSTPQGSPSVSPAANARPQPGQLPPGQLPPGQLPPGQLPPWARRNAGPVPANQPRPNPAAAQQLPIVRPLVQGTGGTRHTNPNGIPLPPDVRQVNRPTTAPGQSTLDNPIPTGGTPHRFSRQPAPVQQAFGVESFQHPVRQVQGTTQELFFEAPATQAPAPQQNQPADTGFEFAEPLPANLPASPPESPPYSPPPAALEITEPAATPAPWALEAETPTPLQPAAQQSPPAQAESPLPAFDFPEPARLEESSVSGSTQTMFSTSADPMPVAAAPELDKIHEVQPGDNYWTISRAHYGSARYFAALAEYNRKRIARPEHMKPGMKVLVPSVDLLNERYAKLTGYVPQEKLPPGVPVQGFFVDAQGQPMFRIGKDDTLTDIAEVHLGRSTRWVQIFGMNRHQLKDPNSLTTGMILRLPADASQIVLGGDAAISR